MTESQMTDTHTPPFPNCKYRMCDLPGQCISEGGCHHPREGERALTNSAPSGVEEPDVYEWPMANGELDDLSISVVQFVKKSDYDSLASVLSQEKYEHSHALESSGYWQKEADREKAAREAAERRLREWKHIADEHLHRANDAAAAHAAANRRAEENARDSERLDWLDRDDIQLDPSIDSQGEPCVLIHRRKD
jgi:hypothetical protein